MIDFKKKPRLWTFLASFLLSGIVFWLTPYDDIALIQPSFSWKWIVIVAVVAFFAGMRTQMQFRQVMVFSALGFPASFFARVVVEGTLNPGTHNLWPIALVLSVIIGVVGALIGTPIGLHVRKKGNRVQTNEGGT